MRSYIKRWHERHGPVEKEENCMKLVLVFAVVAAVIVACLLSIKRDSKDESANSFHRLGL